MKRFRLICSFLLVTVTMLSLLACGSKNVAVAIDNGNTNTKKFVVGFDAEYPPYGYLSEDGKSYEGFDLDLAREFCKRAGYEFVAQPIDWDSKDLELNSGNIDCIWNGFTVTGRENDYTWTFPYVDNSIVLIAYCSLDTFSLS